VQSAYVCYERQKLPILTQLFRETPPTRTIIFSSSKLKVKELTAALSRLNIRVEQMHSDLTQEKREEVMKNFKSGNIDLLVATDVVARGIDIDNIRMVINYDIPHDPEDYVHRIGRTARGGNDEGLAITFVIDFTLRALPFKILEPLRDSRFVSDMAVWMPPGIMLILVLSTLTQGAQEAGGRWWAALVATGVTVAVHLLFGRKLLWSVGIGTVCYVTLLNWL